MNLATYLGLLHQAEQTLANAFRQVSDGHAEEPDIHFLCQTLATQCENHVKALQPIVARYGEDAPPDNQPERLHADSPDETRSGPVGLLRDLQDVHMLAAFVESTWTLVGQAAAALRDKELLDAVSTCKQQTHTQIKWLETRMKQAAPQALVVAQ
jgi:ferritin-like metal-binding protein YciE